MAIDLKLSERQHLLSTPAGLSIWAERPGNIAAALRLEFGSITVVLNGNPVITDLSARLESGQITTVSGPNGCGKSTLLAVLSGHLVPASGTVTLSSDEGSAFPLHSEV